VAPARRRPRPRALAVRAAGRARIRAARGVVPRDLASRYPRAGAADRERLPARHRSPNRRLTRRSSPAAQPPVRARRGDAPSLDAFTRKKERATMARTFPFFIAGAAALAAA